MRSVKPAFGLLLVAFFLVAQGIAFGQSTPSPTRPEDFFKILWNDQKLLWSSPFRLQTWSTPRPYLLIAISGAAFPLDGDPARRLRENPGFERFNEVLASTASDVVLAAFPLGVLAAGELAGSPAVSEYGMKATRSALNAYSVALVLKTAFGRARPHTGEVYGFWDCGNSFPSGHAVVAWAVAATTVRHFEEHRWVGWVAYPLAAAVSFSRVTSGHHFPSDAVSGAALGFAIGRWGIR